MEARQLFKGVNSIKFYRAFSSDEECYKSSSKMTLTDYQCVSTECCIHIAKSKIGIDNQHVTKSLQRYIFLPKQPKENTEKITNLTILLDSDGCSLEREGNYLNNYNAFICSWAVLMASLLNSSSSPSTASRTLSANQRVSISFSS